MSLDTLRLRIADMLESPPVQKAVIGLILLNAVIFGLETVPSVWERAGGLLAALDHAILALFTAELAARLFAFGRRFFRDPWSVFDLLVVAVALIPASGSLSALRALRVLRVLRLVSALPRLRAVVDALLSALPGMASVAALLVLLLYVGAVIATKLFGAGHPDLFGSLGASLLTLFQILTLEGWADIMRDIMKDEPLAWLFFVPFVLVATFAVLNLVVAVIVDSMQTGVRETAAEEERREERILEEMKADLRAIREDLASLRTERLGAGG